MKLKVLDLFSGIGGFSLGLERTGGFETVAFCEIDQACQKVLKKHWPDVPIFEDVSALARFTADNFPEDENGFVECTIHQGEDFGDCECIGHSQFIDELGSVDVIVGGFPCQDISLIGKGAGLEGERSGLWWEYHRLIQAFQPKWVIIENVSALRTRGLDQVLRSLSEIGYDAEWHCIPASAVGAPHQRDRIWIVAYPHNSGLEGHSGDVGEGQGWQADQAGSATPQSLLRGTDPSPWWSSEPGVGRVVDGIPNRVDRHKQLGNAVVPQIPELIGKAILQSTR